MAFMAKDKIVRTGDDLNLATLVGLQTNATALNTLAPNATALNTLAPNATTLNNVATAAAGVAFSRVEKIARVALGDADTGGGVLAWPNPESGTIIVTRLIVDVTTASTGACDVSFGVTATSATTSSANLLDEIDVNGVAIFDNLDASDAGTLGKTKQKLAAGKWVTGSKASGAAAGLAGFAYIHYVLA